jgi:hypothetical protein
MRGVADVVAFCLQYELEDVVAEVTGADRVDVGDTVALERSRRAYRLARMATRSRRVAHGVVPRPSTVTLERDYGLFFPVFNHAHELFALATVPGWRKRCRVAACFVNELWADKLPRYLLELLRRVRPRLRGPPPHRRRGGTPGRAALHLPSPGDGCPSLFAAARAAGTRHRRLQHRPPVGGDPRGARPPGPRAADLLLLRHHRRQRGGRKQRTFHVDNPAEHRLLLAGLLQRSRYFIANRSRVNEPEVTKGRDEISGRFYEGAAAGTVMLGEGPRTEEFQEQFDWPGAVTPLPFDSPDAGRVLAALDDDPARLAQIRNDNVRNAALRHDWVHRIRDAFKTLGLAPTEGMRAREARLQALAALESGPAPSGRASS